MQIEYPTRYAGNYKGDKTAHTGWAAILIAMLLCPLGTASDSGFKFVWLSDLHFDPTGNPKLVDVLA